MFSHTRCANTISHILLNGALHFDKRMQISDGKKGRNHQA